MDSKIDKKSYTNDDVKTAITRVTLQGWSLYKASRIYRIPYSTLKSRLRNIDPTDTDTVKVGRPFNLSTEQEQAIVAYVKEIQETGLKLTPTDIRRYAYKISREKYKNRFNDSKKIAGWDWWLSFKKRYDICTTVNFLSPVSSVDKSDQFFHFYKTFIDNFSLNNKPHLVWSFISTHFCYVTESSSTKPTRKKPETVNVLLSLNAAGERGPCAIVSKSPIVVEDKSETFEDSFITVSENGSISQNVFYDYLTWFVKKAPKERPVVIILNSKNEFMSSRSRIYAKLNGITLLPFSFEDTFVLETLHSFFVLNLKQSWRKSIGNFVKKMHYKPVLDDFLDLFSPVFLEGTSEENIVNGLSKTGIWPINPSVVKSKKNKSENSNENFTSVNPTDILNQMYENTDQNIINDLESSLKNIENDDEVLIVLVG